MLNENGGGGRTGIKVLNHVLLLLFSKYKNTCRAKALPDVDSIYLQSKRPLNGLVCLALFASIFLSFLPPSPPSLPLSFPPSLSCNLNLIWGLAPIWEKMLKPSQQVSLPLRKSGTAGPLSEGSAAPHPAALLQQKATASEGATRTRTRRGKKGSRRAHGAPSLHPSSRTDASPSFRMM